METSIRALTEQVKALSPQPPQNRTPGATTPQYYTRGSPIAAPVAVHLRQQGLPMPAPAGPAWQSGPPNLPRQDMSPMPINNQGMMYPMQILPPSTPQQQMQDKTWESTLLN